MHHTTTTNTNRMPRLGKKFLCRLSTLAGVAALSALTFPALNAAEEAAPTPPPTTPKAASSAEKTAATATTTPAAPVATAPTGKTTPAPAATKTTAPSPKKSPGADSDTLKLAPVVVEAIKLEGSSLDGYLSGVTKQVGIWGELEQQNTPYSMVVMPGELIKNINITDTQQIIRMIPGAYDGFTRSNFGIVGFDLRGFGTTALMDGIRMAGTQYGITLEDTERIEVMPGFTGFLYGGGFAGGAVNYVLKRPTDKYLNSITTGNAGGKEYYAHGDFGGPIPGTNGKLGYRFNALYSDGEASRDFLRHHQEAYTGVLSWKITPDLVWAVDASYKDWEQKGDPFNGVWANYPDTLPPPPKANRIFGQKWSLMDSETYRLGSNLTWKISDHINLRSAYRWQRNENFYKNGGSAQFPGDVADIYASKQDGGYSEQSGGNVYVDFKFDTFGIKHTLTTGVSIAITEAYNRNDYLEMGYAGQVTFENPYIPEPQWGDPNWPVDGVGLRYGPIGGPYRKTSHNEYANVLVGDKIDIGEHVTAMLGANYTRVNTRGYGGTVWGVTSHYNQTRVTPNVSLLYKPVSWITTYATWLQAAESGITVPQQDGNGWIYRNAGKVLKPTISDQGEVGVKATISDRLLLTAAFFYINKANYFTERHNDYTLTYTQDGRQIHTGLELGASGKVFKSLTIWGGFTVMDATIEKTNNDAQRNRTPANVPEIYGKLYAEYQLPFLDGLYVTGGAYYTGSQKYSADRPDDRTLCGYTIFDLGGRYEVKIKDVDTVFRVNIQNLTDKRYWTRATSAHVGDPLTVTFSATVNF